MNIYRSVIIDDDLFTREQLHDKVKKNFPELNIVAVCNDATSGMQAIELHKPHLVFLDIEMPDFTGFEMLNPVYKITYK
jgi:two-component system LytT family response regulator